MKTTLNKIREHGPCQSGWGKLLRTLGKTKADNEPVSVVQILDSNGLDDALWCLRAVTGHDCEIRLFAVWCAHQVEHLMSDERSKNALVIAERFANGEAKNAAMAAARAAARAAAWDAAWDAAMAAARAAAGDAARAAAWDAAGAAASAAAGDAARAAAWDAAGAAASAACAVTWAAAGDAAWDAAKKAQEARLRQVCLAIDESSHQPAVSPTGATK
jgi:hypothetical protein